MGQETNKDLLTTVTSWIPVVRTIALLTMGLVISVQQTFFAPTTDPYLLGFAALLMGIPLALKLDKALKIVDNV